MSSQVSGLLLYICAEEGKRVVSEQKTVYNPFDFSGLQAEDGPGNPCVGGSPWINV